MDAKVLYWTGALINMAVVVGFAIAGILQVRAGRPRRHFAFMSISASLVVAFVVSYGLKLIFLGREDLSQWSTAAVRILRFHECCILVMVVCGILSIVWGRRLRKTRSFSLDPSTEPAAESLVRRHRLAGRVTSVAAVSGLISAGFVLAGMYARLPS